MPSRLGTLLVGVGLDRVFELKSKYCWVSYLETSHWTAVVMFADSIWAAAELSAQTAVPILGMVDSHVAHGHTWDGSSRSMISACVESGLAVALLQGCRICSCAVTYVPPRTGYLQYALLCTALQEAISLQDSAARC